MPEQHDRTGSWPISKRVVQLLTILAFAGLSLFSVWPSKPPALAKTTEAKFNEPESAAPTALATSNGQPLQQTTVGRECQQCHSAIVESFPNEVHGKSAKFLNDERSAKCEACHANSSKHAETSTRSKEGEPTVLLVGEKANEACLSCHARDQYLFEWKGGQHDRKDMSCLSCHSVHHAKRLETMLASPTVEEGCFSCHKDKRKALLQRSTHLFRTENWVRSSERQTESAEQPTAQATGLKISCVACHNPHGGGDRKMLVARSVNDTCYICHAEKRGPFLWEHSPVQENCMTCHSPHGSNNERLLTQRSHLLCQECHINILARHETVAGFDVFTFNRGCVNCHTQIHGSNSPAGKAFVR